MKLLLVLAAAGLSCAAPEADPAFAYSVGHPLVYTHPVTYTVPTVAYHPYAYGYPYGGLLPIAAPAAADAAEEPAVEEARKKREADPAVLGSFSTIKNPSPSIYHNVPALAYYAPYAHPLTYGGLIYGRKKREAEAGGCRDSLGYLVPCAGRKKREAEAEAEADPEADPWLVYGYPYAYRHAFYHPYAYAHVGGCRNYLGGLVPCAGR